ncbi:SP family arabinose:H+ symporter-like MFS transporter/SP family xylose:H+ symportor-like MFS transporter [Thermoflavifilum aggregans]|uniref:SP family arabinose:H+ symporter-like MFS transporter/SP family xylose:H+ symportor-like MFS transporter n=1 Tax=Thermoflavifilum aggregans TaxID=454188 RepID=A0A2M9CVC0_9BACT|nr:sugar porter family MFS transporter [Thermoflavifilum aggregans]PJJ75825.1 SP family arabinose:H+ symporter-like MFS transporter/SP family xylose:H+ symportor-like MFS transporter [Thermoflavifilum aggregans]
MKRYVIVISAVAALGGLLFGFDTAVIAGTLTSLKIYFHLRDSAIGLVVAAASIGCIPGAFFAGKLADQYGRKPMMLTTAVLYIITSLGCGIAWNFTALVIFRFIGGIAIGMASTLAPIYISEVAPADIRGRLGMIQQLAIVIGILIAFISNYYIANASFIFLSLQNHWRYMLAAALIPSLIFFLLLLLIPESPRWLIIQNKLSKAKEVFNKIFDSDKSTVELDAVLSDVKKDSREINFNEIFTDRYKKIVIIGIVFAAIAQLTGINTIFYYAPLIFEKTHVGGSVLFQTILTGIANLIFTIVAFALIDRIGRKKLLLIGSFVMALCMFFIGYLFYARKLDNYFVLIMIFVYIAAFASTWGVVLWVYVAEIFPNRIRGHATSFAVFGNWTANAIVSFTFPVMLSSLGAAWTFIIYGIINSAMIIFVLRYVFETKGVKLEKIEDLYATV